MKLRETIQIQATPDVVWAYIGSPEVWSSFHVKARNTKLVSPQGGLVGSRYEMQLSVGGETKHSIGEIIDIQTGRLIRLKSELEPRPGQKASAVMAYELEDLGTKTRVYERVDIDSSRINFFIRAIIWFVSQFGSPKKGGETSLMKLKRIVEQQDT